MKISIMGINQNELLSGTKLAEMGNEVVYVCRDDKRIDNIRRGHYTDSEKEILIGVRTKKDMNFTADLREALDGTNMCFISENDAQSTLFNILSNAKEVGANMSNHTFIIDRSELAISRLDQIKNTIQSELDKRASSLTFEVISDSSFLRA